jgi:hypothetical protein
MHFRSGCPTSKLDGVWIILLEIGRAAITEHFRRLDHAAQELRAYERSIEIVRFSWKVESALGIKRGVE